MKFCSRDKLVGFGGRPPHGGRGLKFVDTLAVAMIVPSSPSRGTWIEMLIINDFFRDQNVVPLTGDVD